MISAGLFAALPTPTRPDGGLDLHAFDRIVEFVCGAGVDGICIGGATSEFPLFGTGDRIAGIRRAAECLPKDRLLFVGIGAPSVRATIELGEAAKEAGSRAVLLPMPSFFRYEQEDLLAYCGHVSRTLRWPCLLYDLPDFTNPLLPDSSLALMHDEAFIVGIKDSSGRTGNLAKFADARGDLPWTLLVGDDRLLLRGLETGWNGGISGIAACCPELLCGVYRSFVRGRVAEAASLQTIVNEFVSRLCAFPAPWAIRAALDVRGFMTGSLPLPLSPHRQKQIAEFKEWFTTWLDESGAPAG